MGAILLPIVGVGILEMSRIQAEEGIMREKHRAAIVLAEGQGDSEEITSVAQGPVFLFFPLLLPLF